MYNKYRNPRNESFCENCAHIGLNKISLNVHFVGNFNVCFVL